MADSIYVKVGNEVEPLDLGGGSSPEYVERIEALEAFASTQAAKDEAQDTAISTAQNTANAAGQAAANAQTSADAAGRAAANAQSSADAANQGLVGVVRTVNGESADAAGNVALDHLTKNGVNLYLAADGNAWISDYRAIRNKDIIIVGGTNSITVPSGGTWAVFAIYWTASYGNSAPVNGVYAGGTVIKGDANAHSMGGLCIKIT